MQLKSLIRGALAGALILAPAAAFAATATGTISYISADGKTILLNSTDEYTLGPKVDVSKLSISQRVKLTWSGSSTKRTATVIGPEPVAPAK
jgi:hypothetical protein